MKQHQGLGSEQPRDREDHDGDGAPDLSELDFTEAGQTQPQPAERHPGRETPRDTHGHAG